jgi:hypothetical protein
VWKIVIILIVLVYARQIVCLVVPLLSVVLCLIYVAVITAVSGVQNVVLVAVNAFIRQIAHAVVWVYVYLVINVATI